MRAVRRAADQVRLHPDLPAALADRVRPDLGAVRRPDAPPAREGAVVVLTPAAGGRPGAALLDAVRVMDRLRSPGGCPWDAAQTPASLLRYLVEETYELYDAVADGDRAAVREELGDVLLQVLFHARIAQEDPDGFGIDDVAEDLVTKLVARHPHVFADGEVITRPAEQQVRWEELKAVEKRRASALDGVARAQPAAALVAKYLSRGRAGPGVPDDLLAAAVPAGTDGAELYAGCSRTTPRRPGPRGRPARRRGRARRAASVPPRTRRAPTAPTRPRSTRPPGAVTGPEAAAHRAIR